MNNLNTIQNRILMAKKYEQVISTESNTYIGIGVSASWPENDLLVPKPLESTNSIFEVYRNLVSIKKITGADLNLVVPRVDWSNNTVYTEYTENEEIFAYSTKEQLSGNVSATSTSLNVTGQTAFFTANLSVGDFIIIPGDGISVPEVKKEIVSITNNDFMMVNSSFGYTYTQNSIYKVTNSNYPYYAKEFYVRNSRDQIFKCLLNNSAAESTVEPEIDIGGQLPENPYIQTSDGYKWKYLYTIPSGLKEKFFTAEWMPVINNEIVNDAAVDGRLDIIKIISGGSGYLSGSNSTSANIVSVIGDGTSANLTANVYNGSISAVNILNGGQNYTRAILEIDNTLGGSGANLIAVISPKNGHGFDSEKELGATHLMLCSELDGNELGKFPTENTVDNFDYRQISILKNVLDSDGLVANNTRYRATYYVQITPPAGDNRFSLDDIVYQGTSNTDTTFTGTVAFWDEGSDYLWINNTTGTIVEGIPLYKDDNSFFVGVGEVTNPEIQQYSGELLYVKNNLAITRDEDQVEQIKIVVSF